MARKHTPEENRLAGGEEWSSELDNNEKRLNKVIDKDSEFCFYCGGVAPKSGEGDHFPYPYNVGGSLTVPCCKGCHHMKDNCEFGDWNVEWLSAIFVDFESLSRESKLFFAKSFKLFAEYRHLSFMVGHANDVKDKVRILIEERTKLEADRNIKEEMDALIEEREKLKKEREKLKKEREDFENEKASVLVALGKLKD